MTKPKTAKSEVVSDFDLVYKHDLNYTQRVLYRIMMRMAKLKALNAKLR